MQTICEERAELLMKPAWGIFSKQIICIAAANTTVVNALSGKIAVLSRITLYLSKRT